VRDYIIDTIKPPGTIKKQDSIDKWYAEQFDDAVEEALHKTSFDGAMCHIIAIGCAANDDPPVCFYAEKPDEEQKLLRDFFEFVSALSYPTIVGHNVLEFDIKIIKQRSMILGVERSPAIPWDAKPWDKNPFDTMKQWDQRNNIGLDKLAKAMGFDGKSGINGSMVYGMWQSGKHDQIKAYCMDDVDQTRKVAKRMIGNRY
jgi:predicted PolB exonuclease-like 3'-5' exonuclease